MVLLKGQKYIEKENEKKERKKQAKKKKKKKANKPPNMEKKKSWKDWKVNIPVRLKAMPYPHTELNASF